MDPDDPGSVRSDREAIVETVHRYASTIDGKDYEGLRGVLDDEFAARFGRRDWMVGADDVVAWIAAQSEDQAWQHHLLSVYHVDVVGDTAFVLSYLTAHQVSASEPGTVVVTVGRYHDELRRRGGVWKIARKEVEVGWRETRSSGASG